MAYVAEPEERNVPQPLINCSHPPSSHKLIRSVKHSFHVMVGIPPEVHGG